MHCDSMEIVKLKFHGFDWDNGNLSKLKKHRIEVEMVESCFFRDVLLYQDEIHSKGEDRFIAIGINLSNRELFIAFTFRNYRNKKLIRVISARFMHLKEKSKYEKLKEKIK